jgi:membrane protein DedA with SNARE-associated domain
VGRGAAVATGDGVPADPQRGGATAGRLPEYPGPDEHPARSADQHLGAYLGALLLYSLAARIGQDRSIRLLSRLPLVDREDFERADGWFSRHGRASIFFGRLIPGVRSLISLPAGAQRMNLATFSGFTIAGSGLWNGVLLGAGAALGTQYGLVQQYSRYVNYAVWVALAALVVWLIVRRIRRGRADAVSG